MTTSNEIQLCGLAVATGAQRAGSSETRAVVRAMPSIDAMVRIVVALVHGRLPSEQATRCRVVMEACRKVEGRCMCGDLAKFKPKASPTPASSGARR